MGMREQQPWTKYSKTMAGWSSCSGQYLEYHDREF
jgi:hypothetical protein